ncbi:hypothetical protein JIN84_18315 [Luteolibacter yonseiensis]|uniref:Uncharacterized protein n=1 Tax=Luteolibacter yonseiensis TaxID=1144680 RepID=A0A934R9M8_9BACT|nr:hypothetical protein [Luteolibacter yonseiensis]MBK1817579.1 hypothetical protein [Luteolibacter yonseiensis]
MKTAYLIPLLTLPLIFANCREAKRTVSEVKTEVATAGDVTFARSAFESLARGDASVAEKIDWPVFTSIGENVGASYIALPSAIEKEKLVNAFITQFATSFRENGGSIDAFTNWRVTAHDSAHTEVAADSSSGILSITVSERDGVEKVSSLNMIK